MKLSKLKIIGLIKNIYLYFMYENEFKYRLKIILIVSRRDLLILIGRIFFRTKIATLFICKLLPKIQ